MSGKFAEKQTPLQKGLTMIGLILCIIFTIMLISNITIIVKGALHPQQPPSVLGVSPMVTLSGSMEGSREGSFPTGSLIFVVKAEPEELKAGDVIAFMDGSAVVTHRIVQVQTAEDGSLQWITKGDANNAEDLSPVPAANLVGKYMTHIPKLGNFVLFMQTPLGMILFMGVPMLGFLIYDMIRRQQYASKHRKKTADMQAEIRRLRNLTREAEASQPEE